jgi:hypothetical protein
MSRPCLPSASSSLPRRAAGLHEDIVDTVLMHATGFGHKQFICGNMTDKPHYKKKETR